MRRNRKPTAGQSFMDFVCLLVFGGIAVACFSGQPSEGTVMFGLASGGMAGIALYGLLFGYP